MDTKSQSKEAQRTARQTPKNDTSANYVQTAENQRERKLLKADGRIKHLTSKEEQLELHHFSLETVRASRVK